MADISDKSPRRLPFPLDEAATVTSSIPEEGTIQEFAWQTNDSSEKVFIMLELSQDEYTALANAVDVGRDIAYNEDSEMIWWLWCRVFKGAVMVNCDDVADCIETSEETQAAIINNYNIQLSNLMENANSGLTYPSVDAENDTIFTIPQAIGAKKGDEIKPLDNCNMDKLWAGIRDGIVQRLDDNARSALEWLVSKADVAERGTALIAVIPIFGSMAKAVLDQMVQLAPDMLNLFESYSSIDHMDEIACEIFGIVCNECRYPTYDEVFQYYASAGITGFTDIDDLVIALATDLLFGSMELAALAFYHTMIAYELLVLYLGSKFYGYTGTEALYTMASLGEDFANDNWKVLCDSCDEDYAEYIFDFTVDSHQSYRVGGFAGSILSGDYVAGKGWKISAIDSTNGLMQWGMVIDPTWIFVAVAYEATVAPGAQVVQFRPTPGIIGGAVGINMGVSTNWTQHANFPLSPKTGMNEFALRYANPMSTNAYVKRVAFRFQTANAPEGARPVNSPNFT